MLLPSNLKLDISKSVFERKIQIITNTQIIHIFLWNEQYKINI